MNLEGRDTDTKYRHAWNNNRIAETDSIVCYQCVTSALSKN